MNFIYGSTGYDVLTEYGESEPSDAETLMDSDSWESDDEVPDNGGSSVSKEPSSEDTESIPEETLNRSGDSEVNLPVNSEVNLSVNSEINLSVNLEVNLSVNSEVSLSVNSEVSLSVNSEVNLSGSSQDVPSVDLCVEELSRSPELYGSAVVLRHDNKEALEDCAHSECSPQFKVIAERNTSPEIFKRQSGSGLAKSGFVMENYIHLMQDHTKSKHGKAQSKVLCSRSVAISDKITGQEDIGDQVLNDSIGIRGHEREPSLEDLCDETRPDQGVQMDNPSDERSDSHSLYLVSNKTLSAEELGGELGALSHVEPVGEMQNRATYYELYPVLSSTNSRRPLNSTFTVMLSVATDNNDLAQREEPIFKDEFSFIKRRCRVSDLQKSDCLDMNLSDSNKSSSSVSLSDTKPEIGHKSGVNISGFNQMAMSTMVSSKDKHFPLTTFSSQPTDQSLVKLPNRLQDLSAGDNPALTLCDSESCHSAARPVNSLSGSKTTSSEKPSCLADPMQQPSMRRFHGSVIPKVIPQRPLMMSELPACAANRAETHFNDLEGTYGPEVQMVEKPFSISGNSGSKTTCSKKSFCLTGPMKQPSVKTIHEIFDGLKSVIPKVIPHRPLMMSALPTCAANRADIHFNDLAICNETSSVSENIDQDDCIVAGTYGPEVQVVEKPLSILGNHSLPGSGLTNSSTEHLHSNCASCPDCCIMAQRNCNTASPACLRPCSQAIRMSALPKTPKQQIGNAFLNLRQQKACADSSTSSCSPSECFSKMKLLSPAVLVTHVASVQNSWEKCKRDIFQQAGKVAEINNNNSSNLQPESVVSCDQKLGTLMPNMEDLRETVDGVTAMKEVEQLTDSTSYADQIVGRKDYWFNKSEVSQEGGDRNVSMQSLSHSECGIRIKTDFSLAENLTDIASDTDEESDFLSLLSDTEEGKSADDKTNVKQKVIPGDCESEGEVDLAEGATSSPSKDESGFILDVSFLSSISDSSEIDRIKELAMEIACEEDLEETLIEKTKQTTIKSSVTAEPTEKTDLASVTSSSQITEGDDKSLERFEFLSSLDELQGIGSLAVFRHLARSNRMKTQLETASREVIKFSANRTVHDKAMRKTDEQELKTGNICARDSGKMYNQQTEKLLKPVSIPITKILEINDNDMIFKTNSKALKTNLEMGKISGNVKTVVKTEDKTKNVCVGLRHPNSLTMPVASSDTIQVRKTLTRVSSLGQTVAPASTFVSSEAQLGMKLSGNLSSASVDSVVEATCSNDSRSAWIGADKCSPLLTVSPQPNKKIKKIKSRVSQPSWISAPAELCHSFYGEKIHRKSENDRTSFSHCHKATNSQSDVISVIPGSSHKARVDGYLPYPRKIEVGLGASHKTPKRSSDNCHLEHDRSTKRCRTSLWESSDNGKKINEKHPDEKLNEARDERPRFGLHASPTSRTNRWNCFSSVVIDD